MTDKYRGWTIHYDPPPIPIRDFDWQAYGPNYDASWEGEEDGYVSNGEDAQAATREKLIEEIDAWLEENPTAVEHDTGDGIGELISEAEGKVRLERYAALGIETGTAKSEALSAQHESPTLKGERP